MVAPLLFLALLQAPNTQLAAVADSLHAGSIDVAIDLAQRYTWDHRKDAAGYLLLGDAWAAKKPMGGLQALQNYRLARDLEPKDPDPPYRMAQLALRLGGADGERILRESLERVMSIDPLYKNAWQQWLLAYRNTDGREQMIKILRPFAANPTVKGRLAQLEIENESYHTADSLLAGAIAADSTDPEWLALRAQSSLEQGDTVLGFGTYARALAHADRDTADVLWRQIVGIVTPAEYVAWAKGVRPGEKGSWIESFWARRNPDLFAGVNNRVLEHFERLRYARRQYPLLHPFTNAQRNLAARGADAELTSARDRGEYLDCEATEGMTNGSKMDMRNLELSPLVTGGFRTGGLEVRDEAPLAAGSENDLASVDVILGQTIFAPLNMDIRGADTVAARIGYNLATGLSDRGLTYLRFGPPRRGIVGNTNLGSSAQECFRPDVERWRYDNIGEVRFSIGTIGSLPGGDITFNPQNAGQYEAMKLALTTDAPSEPAPLQFGVWFAQFRDSLNPRLTDFVVISTKGEIAATLVGTVGGDRGIRQSQAGYVTIHDRPGPYTVLADARVADTLGRQTLAARLRSWDSLPAVSDLLTDDVWTGGDMGRGAALDHVRRDLTFLS
ncbi:MAG TPA: hypothetical protein VEV39_15855, partial [Gemmatimonadales bacterium]|nr:hypothetical protein [Gemmatimonadales bacterium]